MSTILKRRGSNPAAARSAPDENSDAIQPRLLSVVPFLIFMIGSAWYFPKFMSGGQIDHGDAGGGWFRQVFFGSAYLLAAVSVLRNSRLIFPVMLGQWLHIGLLTLVIGSALWSIAPAKVAINFVHLSGAFLIAISMGVNLSRNPGFFHRRFAVFTIVTLGASIILATKMPAYGKELIGTTVRWVGVGSHPNQLGILGALGIWTGLSLFSVRATSADIILSFVAIVLGFVVVIGANSVTSLIVAIALVGWYLYVGGSKNQQIVIMRAMLAGVSALIIMVSIYIVAPEVVGLKYLFGMVGRSENFTGRTDLWAVALQAINEKTLVGWGFDSLASLNNRFGIAYGQFHNGYLDLLVRGGVISLLLLLAMIGRAVYSGLKVWGSDRAIAMSALAMCLFALLHNVTEASFIRATHPLWLMLVIAFVAIGDSTSDMRTKI